MDIRAAAAVPHCLGLAWHGRAAEPPGRKSLARGNSVLYGVVVPACQMSVVSHKTPKSLTTAQHYRDLLVSVKLSMTTTMFQLSQKAPIVLVFWTLLATRICHPIRLADKVLPHRQLLHLVSRFHQRRNWCSECR